MVRTNRKENHPGKLWESEGRIVLSLISECGWWCGPLKLAIAPEQERMGWGCRGS